MEEASLLSLPEGMHAEHIQITEHGLVIEIEASHPTSCCPLCAQPSDSIKTHYRRALRDAPCAGRQVQLILTVRKFYCRNAYCSQKVFTERLPTFVEPWSRMTIRCSQHITSIGLATFCQASASLKKAYDLLQDFLLMVHKREGRRLDAWLARVAESGLPELQSFAARVEKDKDAVQAGLAWPINNGMVEGHVTKLKLIKRIVS